MWRGGFITVLATRPDRRGFFPAGPRAPAALQRPQRAMSTPSIDRTVENSRTHGRSWVFSPVPVEGRCRPRVLGGPLEEALLLRPARRLQGLPRLCRPAAPLGRQRRGAASPLGHTR